MNELYFASQNLNKWKEILTIFDNSLPEISLKNISSLDQEIQERFAPKEIGKTFLENAWIKAKELKKDLPNKLIFAEDSGLVVPALGGAPGVNSSRYGNNDKERIQRLLHETQKLDCEARKAYFFAAICFIQNNDEIFFHGLVWGEILHKLKGKNGFGYDPIFYLPSEKKSFAELTFKEKTMCSHRSKAIGRFINFIINNNLK